MTTKRIRDDRVRPPKRHPWRNPDGLRADTNGRHPALPDWRFRMVRR